MIITERITLMTTGERLKAYRVAQGLTQTQLSRLSAVPASEISKIESGVILGTSALRLSKLALALGVTTSHLLGEVPFLAEWPRDGAPYDMECSGHC